MLAKYQSKKNKGQSLLELSIGLAALIPIMLVVFDLSVIVIAIQSNDSLCREAARNAAAGDPSTALARATAIVAQANLRTHQGGMLANFQLVSPTPTVTFTSNQSTYSQYAGQYGGQVVGTVNVQTQVDVKPFVVQYAYGGMSPLQFRSSQTFPFTYVAPNTSVALP